MPADSLIDHRPASFDQQAPFDPMTPRNHPANKISETLLRFAEPVVVKLGPQASEAELTKALEVCVAIWNAMVLDAARNETKNLNRLQAALGKDRDEEIVLQLLINRKRQYFADDLRGIVDFQVLMKNGSWIVRAKSYDQKV
jgi:hypothetical protein